MRRARALRLGLATILVAIIATASVLVVRKTEADSRTHVVAYFENSNGLFVGDDVRIRGVKVGTVEAIEARPTQVKVTFWFDDKFAVPADAKAVILSPTLVTARAIQLTPPFRGGPTLRDNAVIPKDRTAVPVEWDDLREQLVKLTKMLQPTQPGGVSTLGALVNTTADNLRGQGANIRQAIIELSQAVSALGDHSGDTFTTVKNLATLVSALQDSTVLMRDLNKNLASVTGLFTNNPGEVSAAIKDMNDVVGEVQSFVAENRDTLGTTSDKLASVAQTLTGSLDDIKQLLHVLPTLAANTQNVYQPAQGTLSGIAAVNEFADPITFLCGAIQAASRLGGEQSSKLCVQYLAPIIKNRQYNFPPLGLNPFVGASARPNEVTYSEDWMRPDHVPTQPPAANPPQASFGNSSPLGPVAPVPPVQDPSAAAPPVQTDPAAGLPGMMLPTPGGLR